MPDDLDPPRDALQRVQEIIFREFAPPFAVIDANGNINDASPTFGEYVDISQGRLPEVATSEPDECFAAVLQALLREAAERHQSVERTNVPARGANTSRRMRVSVRPLGNSSEPLFLLILENRGEKTPSSVSEETPDEINAELMRERLEQALEESRAELENTINELKVANEQLRDSEGRARALIAASSQMVWTTDPTGQVVEDSPSWRAFTGQTYDEWRGSGWLNVVHPDDQHATLAAWEKAVETKSPYIVDYRVRRADGIWRWTSVHGVPQLNSDGSVLRWVGMNTDISDRKEAEAREAVLRETIANKEERLSMALKSAGMAAWEWSPAESIWDERLFELLELPATATASPDLFFKYVHPDDQQGLKQAWDAAVKGLRPYNHEFRIITPGGHIRWLAAIGECIRDESGKVSRIYGLNWDITTKKELEIREKRQSEVERYLSEAGAALASSLDFETTLDKVTQLCVPQLADWAFIDLVERDGTVRRVSVAHANPRHAELAQSVAQFPADRHGVDHPSSQGIFRRSGFVIPEFTEDMLVKAARNARHESVLRQMGPRSFIVVPLVARDLTFGVLTLIASDSGRRYSREDLSLAEELARRAAVAIDNARLYQEGQLANAAKSEFLANMSHEIRTPMTAVLGYTDLLYLDERSPERIEFLNTIKRNGEFLLDIINDILDLSKIEAGKIEMHREQFPPHEVVADVRSLMMMRATEKNLTLDVEFATEIPDRIESDPKRLKQILVNLVGNAIKFTEFGGVRLVVSCEDAPVGPQLKIDVVDTGIGLSPEQLGSLFEPFSQGDASVTRRFGGSGLGLTISRRLAIMLGGDITVKSEPDHGSTFTCIIAAGDVESSQKIVPRLDLSPRESAEAYHNHSLTGHILVVDDRRDVRFLARHFLVQAGATVEFAEDGIEAIETVGAALESGLVFDVILLDMQMPRLDGYQTAVRLRQLGYRRPIIALTANAMQGDEKRCLECGCDAYLSKPIDVDALLDMVTGFVAETNPRKVERR